MSNDIKYKFNKNDYNSSNGMQTSMFGTIWFILHLISFNYPIEPTDMDKKHYTMFIKSLGYVLPCVYCRDNYEKNLKHAGFNISVMKNRDTFSKFIYKLHNTVNKMLDKKVNISYTEVRDRYEFFRSRCNETKVIISSNNKKEKKCENSIYGLKAQAIIEIHPKGTKKDTFINKCGGIIKRS